MPANFASLPFTVTARPQDDHKYGGSCAANCYLTMPFNSRARVEIANEGENAYIQVSVKRDRASVATLTYTTSITISITSYIQNLMAKISSISMLCGRERTLLEVGPLPRCKPTRVRRRSPIWTGKTTMSYSRQREQEITSAATTPSYISKG